jgi:hypothetical protein
MSIPEEISSAFFEQPTEVLKTFPNTISQCVASCAYISARLSERAVFNKVALGSIPVMESSHFNTKGRSPHIHLGPLNGTAMPGSSFKATL